MPAKASAGTHSSNRLRHLLDAPWIEEKHRVSKLLGGTRHVRGDDWATCLHCLERRKIVRAKKRRENERCRPAVQLGKARFGNETQELDMFGQTEASGRRTHM